jgi:hypothetical protein
MKLHGDSVAESWASSELPELGKLRARLAATNVQTSSGLGPFPHLVNAVDFASLRN